eukprot:184392-Amphidinium_carterae.1
MVWSCVGGAKDIPTKCREICLMDAQMNCAPTGKQHAPRTWDQFRTIVFKCQEAKGFRSNMMLP